MLSRLQELTKWVRQFEKGTSSLKKDSWLVGLD